MMRMFQSGPAYSLQILNREDVQSEIKLTDDEKGKLDALRAGARGRFTSAFADMRNAGGDVDREAMMKIVQTKMQAIFEDMAKEALGALDQDQRKRVQELAIQSQGSLAVLQPSVAKEIGLTPAQKAQIDDLQNRQDEANQGLFEQAQNGDIEREERDEKIAKNKTILDANVTKVLTETQRTKLKEMSGKPFEFKDPKPGTPGSFGRPGGGR